MLHPAPFPTYITSCLACVTAVTLTSLSVRLRQLKWQHACHFIWIIWISKCIFWDIRFKQICSAHWCCSLDHVIYFSVSSLYHCLLLDKISNWVDRSRASVTSEKLLRFFDPFVPFSLLWFSVYWWGITPPVLLATPMVRFLIGRWNAIQGE